MARRVYFSFHYEEDIWRVNQVRHAWFTKDWEANTPIDHASWEALKRQGDAKVYRWIDNQLYGAGVTVVLIGAYTSTRKFVKYEVQRSADLGKGVLGIRIHNLQNQNKQTSWWGQNPLGVYPLRETVFLSTKVDIPQEGMFHAKGSKEVLTRV